MMGIEPTTSSATNWRSNLMSYTRLNEELYFILLRFYCQA
jgi:hypothetical protein